MTAKTRPSQEEQRKRDERYRAFVEQSTEGIWCVEVERPIHVDLPEDEQIRQMYRHAWLAECNDAMARMYGMTSAGQIRGARLGDLLVETDPHNIDFLKAFIRSGYRLRDAESHELDRAGRPRYFLNNFLGVVEDGRLLRAWGVQRDVTEARRMQEDLRQSEERSRRLVDLLPDAVFIHTDGKFDYLNDAAVRLLGAERADDVLGRPIFDIVHPDFREIVEKRMRALHEGKQVTELLQQRVVRLDGAPVDVEIIGSRFAYQGRPSVLVVMRDITTRVTLEAELRDARKRAGERAPSLARRHRETVLIVEDEQVVRDLACDVLTAHGYRVLKARTCAEARKVCEEHDGPIHLLLLDVVMPVMNGPDLLRTLASVRSGMKVLYMSGYAHEAIVHRGVLPPDNAFLQKPFAPDILASRVREILDE
jgi:PAS domain S-box-containing protein